jgi:hypothetical protein
MLRCVGETGSHQFRQFRRDEGIFNMSTHRADEFVQEWEVGRCNDTLFEHICVTGCEYTPMTRIGAAISTRIDIEVTCPPDRAAPLRIS